MPLIIGSMIATGLTYALLPWWLFLPIVILTLVYMWGTIFFKIASLVLQGLLTILYLISGTEQSSNSSAPITAAFRLRMQKNEAKYKVV